MKPNYRHEVIFVETKNKDVFTLKNPDLVEDMGETLLIVTKNSRYSFSKNELVSVWIRNEVCYDFTKPEEKGGDNCEN